MRPLVCAAIIAVGANALAADPPGMKCQEAVLVQYFPGANVARFGDFVQGHLKFLAAQLASGTLDSAGPDGDEGGGFILFTSGDRPAAEAVISKDPLVANHVMNYVLHAWKRCKAAK